MIALYHTLPYISVFQTYINACTLHKKRSFPRKISSVDVTISVVSCGLVKFTEEILK